ncbi:AMP-binding protein [Candidatus Omnitrophota bacterium]
MYFKPSYNLNENFVRAAERFQDRIAIETKRFDTWQGLTYSQLVKKAESLACLMSSLGVKKSDRIAIILENRPEWALVFFALSYIGAVAVPIDSQLPEKDIKNILSDSGARISFISRENQRLYEFFEGLDILEQVVVVGLQEREGKFIPFFPKESIPREGLKRVDADPDDLMLILYTSGTTDIPKGVMLTHKNLCSNFYSVSQLNIFSHKDAILSVLPLYHSYPLMTTLIVPLLSGARIVYVPSDWPEKLIDYLKEARISVFIGVPQIFHIMHGRITKKLEETRGLAGLYVKMVIMLGLVRIFLPKLRNAFGKNLRFFASGGAKLDKIVAKDFLRFGFKILEGYGLTETSPVVSFNPLRKPKVGSVGKAVADVRLKIANKDINGIGEIAIQGPNVMKGYYKDEAKTKVVIKDGWFLSGDLGYLDNDRYLYITGRSKEVIVLSSGKNIYPEEIERHYSLTPYVKEMCVLGVLKEKGRGKIEYLHAIVVPDLEFFKKRGEMNVRKVIKDNFDNLSKALPGYKHVMGFSITQEGLPRTVLGKIRRYEIENKFLPVILSEGREERGIGDEDKVLLESDVAKKLIACIKETLGIKTTMHLQDSIELDLGLDSLGRVELVCAIEKYFNIEIPEEMIAGDIFTIKDLLLRIENLLRERRQESSMSIELDKEQPAHRSISWPEILKEILPPEFQKNISLRAGLVDYVLTFLVKGIFKLFFRIFYNLRVEGLHRIPKKGPYVLCVNHASFFDGFIVAAIVPFRTELDLFFIGFRRYFIAPIVKNLVKRARIIPVDATQIIEAMQSSCFVLEHKKALCVFPEGVRSIDGKVKEFKKGIGIIAKELDVPIVPVFIKGAFEAWPRTRRFPTLCSVKIVFGSPISPKVLIQKGMLLGAKDEYEAISLGIRDEVIKLESSLS